MNKSKNSDKAWDWIIENRDTLKKEELIESLDRYCKLAGYKQLTGSDILWIWENTGQYNDK